MNCTKLMLGLAAFAGLSLAGGAFAGEGHGHDGKAGGHHKGMVGIKAMDTNDDGKLSADEHAAGAKKMFEAMDANKDGKVTAEEMDAGHEQVAGRRPHMGEMSAAEKIKVVDGNGDGILTADEHAAGARMMFDKMDSNKDGQLSKPEFTAGHKMMMKGAAKTDAAGMDTGKPNKPAPEPTKPWTR
jgi:hypothetical protein